MAGNYWEKDAEDPTPALKFYQAAANHGENYGHECLGELYYRQGKYAEAYEQLKLVDELNCCGLYYLGKLYDEGQAVEQDTEKAIELYRQVVDSAEKVANIVGMDQHAVKAKKRLAELQ